MSRTVYALLVGIDDYPSPVPSLRGCVNDIKTIRTILESRIFGDQYQLKVKTLENHEATTAALIAGFREHLCQAGKDDVALFYYSGHGSQARTHKQFLHLEPDGLDETLVCYDSRQAGNFDLADKEISKLISEVAKKNPHVIVILDACHSGSGTRNLSEGVRRLGTDYRERTKYHIEITPDDAQATKDLATDTKTRWLTLPQGRHLLLAACLDDEEAKETAESGESRGVFSYCLGETLRSMNTCLTYRDIFKRVNALVKTKAALQTPVIEATHLEDMDRPFLGGAIQDHPTYFTISFDKDNGWMMDGGAAHGIAPIEGDETTQLALFPIEVNAAQIADLSSSIGAARVTAVLPTRSQVALTLSDHQPPDQRLTYKAIVTATPLAPLAVQVSGNAEGVRLIHEALSKAGEGGKPSLLVRATEEATAYRLIANDDGFRILRASDDRPLAIDLPTVTPESARLAVERLEHIARWLRILETDGAPRRLSRDAVQLEIFRLEKDPATGAEIETPMDIAEQGAELRFTYERRNNKWEAPKIKIKLTNTTDQKLFCMLLDLTEAFKVSSALLPNGGTWLPPKDENATGELWANKGQAITLTLRDEFWKQGVTEFKDWLKLIVSTEEGDATLLEQKQLDITFEKSRGLATRSAAAMNTLQRLMKRVQTRDLDASPEEADSLADWYTSEVVFTTVRPLDSVPTSQTATLVGQVTLVGHAKLKAQARLTNIPQASRDATLPQLPAILRDDPNSVQPFQFTISRSADAGLSVLELTDVDAETVASVTPDDPLTLRVTAPLSANEHILPVAYDGEFFLPLGHAERKADGVEIKVERLPEPVVNARSLSGSIRIFFQKVISEKLGLGYEYPILAVAESDTYGGVQYTQNLDEVKARVQSANRVLLFIHGIIGDTRGMAISAWPQYLKIADDLKPLSGCYDLVLTFDYENINTPIEETARKLKERLEYVGLGAGHTKTLHIAAHSMGGLVSRWFIEHEGGNQMVEHLVMLGTPNAGSPWSTVEDWATTAAGFLLNGMAVVAWPVKVLGGLLKALEMVDQTLDQMHPGSPILNRLADSADPQITYTILAGNTSIIPAALERPSADKPSLFERLLGKLNLQRVLHKSTEYAVFFGHPNDIAVSVVSIKSVPGGWAKANPPHEVACDHISYFSTEAGIRALYEALNPV